MKVTNEQLKLAADTVRCLCADMVEKAKSGHPGVAMGLADVACTLWLKELNVDPKDPEWYGRDRLVFSGGHASSLVYALFHLADMGGVTMDELKNFRQLGARTAGHPERGLMPGVEVTTGPLGQGLAMGVGLALAAKKAGTKNRTWIFCGDGDLEEGISHEAASFAGNLKLDDLIVIYDSNGITIEGSTALSVSDDAKMRFESYGWKVLTVDGHNPDAIAKVLHRATKLTGQPVMIIASTHIGYGAPKKQDTADSHGAPLGADEVAGLKKALGFDPEKSFYVPDEIYTLFRARAGFQHRQALKIHKLEGIAKRAPQAELTRAQLMKAVPTFSAEKPVATRAACGETMTALAGVVKGLVGGSADLGPSNKTVLKGFGDVAPGSYVGRNIHYGIRELAMTAIANGLTAFGGFRGYGSTFFVFSDYCRPAIRLAALMKLPTLNVFSHDSFYVGEDGPTHEPIEQLAALRAMPGVESFRPADANETAWAFVEAMLRTDGPTCVLTTRQNVPVLEGTSAEGVSKGAYVIFQAGAQDASTILFLATGSEVAISLEAAKTLAAEGKGVRVVSMPCVERFLANPCTYRESVIPETMTKRVIVEAGVRFGWDRFRLDHRTTKFVTLDRFGASGPAKVLADYFGFTAAHVLEVARMLA